MLLWEGKVGLNMHTVRERSLHLPFLRFCQCPLELLIDFQLVAGVNVGLSKQFGIPCFRWSHIPGVILAW